MLKELMKQHHCTELHIKYDAPSDCVFIAAMNTTYGNRGNGGTRMMMYNNTMEALEDAVSLVEVMTKKCVIIGKEYNGGFSGGKGVIVGDPKTQKSPDMLRRYGTFIESLHGKLQTGTDMNIDMEDITYMAETSQYIDGLATGLGDTGIPTAHGVFWGMTVCAQEMFGDKSMKGKVVAVQGIGSVGAPLVRMLAGAGATVIVSDIDAQRLHNIQKETGCTIVSPEEIMHTQCDFFSPNAVGGVLTAESMKRLHCRIVLGAANNPLNDGLRTVQALQSKGVVYIPDYVVNIGGVLLSMCETQGKDLDYVMEKTKEVVTNRLTQFLQEAKDRTVYEVAEKFVQHEL